MTECRDFPGVVTDDSGPGPVTEMKDLAKTYERQFERAYKLGVLHGINAQSMAQVKEEVMEFEDYGWDLEND